MKVSSNGKVRRSRDEWNEIITRFAKSGLNHREFCRREKIKKSSFDRWRKRLAEKVRNDFVDITPGRGNSSSWVVEVELAGGTIVRIGS